MFYFAGHGQYQNDRYYLLPHDAAAGRLAATALSASDVGDLLVRTRGRRVVILDTCHAGGFNQAALDQMTELAPPQAGVVLCGTSKSGEVAWDTHPKNPKNGMYAHRFVDTLREGPRAVQGDPVRLGHVLMLTAITVERESREFAPGARKPPQTPWTRCTGEPDPKDIILTP